MLDLQRQLNLIREGVSFSEINNINRKLKEMLNSVRNGTFLTEGVNIPSKLPKSVNSKTIFSWKDNAQELNGTFSGFKVKYYISKNILISDKDYAIDAVNRAETKFSSEFKEKIINIILSETNNMTKTDILKLLKINTVNVHYFENHDNFIIQIIYEDIHSIYGHHTISSEIDVDRNHISLGVAITLNG